MLKKKDYDEATLIAKKKMTKEDADLYLAGQAVTGFLLAISIAESYLEYKRENDDASERGDVETSMLAYESMRMARDYMKQVVSIALERMSAAVVYNRTYKERFDFMKAVEYMREKQYEGSWDAMLDAFNVKRPSPVEHIRECTMERFKEYMKLIDHDYEEYAMYVRKKKIALIGKMRSKLDYEIDLMVGYIAGVFLKHLEETGFGA